MKAMKEKARTDSTLRTRMKQLDRGRRRPTGLYHHPPQKKLNSRVNQADEQVLTPDSCTNESRG